MNNLPRLPEKASREAVIGIGKEVKGFRRWESMTCLHIVLACLLALNEDVDLSPFC